MAFWSIIFVLFLCGCLGGIIGGLFNMQRNNSAVEKKKRQGLGPQTSEVAKREKDNKHQQNNLKLLWDPTGDCQFPGLIIDALLGGIAAVVFWSIYGSFSWMTVIGTPNPNVPSGVGFGVTAGELGGSVLIGVSGGAWLMTEAKKRCAEKNSPS